MTHALHIYMVDRRLQHKLARQRIGLRQSRFLDLLTHRSLTYDHLASLLIQETWAQEILYGRPIMLRHRAILGVYPPCLRLRMDR